MFGLDKTSNLISPNLKTDLDSAKTEQLFNVGFCNEFSNEDSSNSPSIHQRTKKNNHRNKLAKVSISKKHLNIYQKKPKDAKCHRKTIEVFQKKNLSSESFEKILTETNLSSYNGKILSSGDKEEKSQTVEHFHFEKNEIIENKYKILKHLSDGTFGRVLKVRSLINHKIYAMKVIKSVPKYIESAKDEVKILNFLKEKDPENKNHIIQLFEAFEVGKHYFMVFEKLGCSLYDIIRINHFLGYPLKLLQSVIKQMLISLAFLHNLKIVHTDLKPENILFVSNKTNLIDFSKLNVNNSNLQENDNADTISQDSSLSSIDKENNHYYYPENDQIKMIDFGGATFEYGLHSRIINTRQYRAPEVILECCEWNDSSDIWSLGCIIVELYTGKLLFDTHDSYEHLAFIEKAIGNIPYWMANRCDSCWEKNFILDEDYFQENKTYFDYVRNCSDYKSLAKLKALPNLNDIIHPEHSDLKDLLKKMLNINPKRRISCEEALKHSFFSLSYKDFS